MGKIEALTGYYRSRGIPVAREPIELNPDINTIFEMVNIDKYEGQLSPIAHGLLVFEEDGKCYTLLNRDPGANKFNLIGGGSMNGEPSASTFKREAWEETGLSVNCQEVMTVLLFNSLDHGVSSCPLFLVDTSNTEPDKLLEELDSDAIAIINLGWLIEQLPPTVRAPMRDRIAEALHFLGCHNPQ